MADNSGQLTGQGDISPNEADTPRDPASGGQSEIETRYRALQARRTTFRAHLSVSEEAKRRTIRDRSLIALMIVAVYVVGLIFLLGFLSFRFPVLVCDSGVGCANAVGEWKDMASVLLNVVAVAILPVVTLVLGFYFGSETVEARSADPRRSED